MNAPEKTIHQVNASFPRERVTVTGNIGEAITDINEKKNKNKNIIFS